MLVMQILLYLAMWVFQIILKSALELPFILLGPGALIAYWFGYDWIGPSDTAQAGCGICCLASLVLIPDYVMTWIFPLTGGTDNFPIWCENAPSLWIRKERLTPEQMYIKELMRQIKARRLEEGL